MQSDDLLGRTTGKPSDALSQLRPTDCLAPTLAMPADLRAWLVQAQKNSFSRPSRLLQPGSRKHFWNDWSGAVLNIYDRDGRFRDRR
jgi:hypothetical protein